ncbi:MAG: 2-oxo acid dehydrogenase subunit E2 [Bacteroidales bacterium]|nr:2-oxo acid dehydrogenase subunit E2 [Bacteroidales bacterium]MBN2818455.1 2-oxo acid dehydrogenase subunit E2 [Bacteroidales bacterium]
MANIEVTLPSLGEGVIEATITRWLVEPNSQVEEDTPIAEIATDKVDSEIPSPANGIFIKSFFSEGEIPRVGDVIAIIQTSSELDDQVDETLISSEINEQQTPDKKTPELTSIQKTNKTVSENELIISTFIRHYAGQRGISFDELKGIQGSGANHEVTKTDVLNYFKTRNPISSAENSPMKKLVGFNMPKQTDYIPKEGEEVVELGKTRKLIAEHMLKSVLQAPHVTSFIEVDITSLVQWREQNKHRFKKENGINLTYTPIITELVVRALKEYPQINSSLFGDKLILKKYFNIGIATALPNNDLIVPVVRDADKKSLLKLAIDIADLTNRARENKLKPGETSGGTFTITNLGQVGNVSGTPIINQPESAILAVGTIQKKPWVVNADGQNSIGIRDILTLSLSYDHRIIDGILGGSFLKRIGELLETFSAVV